MKLTVWFTGWGALTCWNRGFSRPAPPGGCQFAEWPEARGQEGEDRAGAGPPQGVARSLVLRTVPGARAPLPPQG